MSYFLVVDLEKTRQNLIDYVKSQLPLYSLISNNYGWSDKQLKIEIRGKPENIKRLNENLFENVSDSLFEVALLEEK